MSSNIYQRPKNSEQVGGTIERAMLTRIQESGDNSSSSSVIPRKEAEQIVIDGRDDIHSVALLLDGKHVVSSDGSGKIRRWRVEDGEEVGTAMDVGSFIFNIAVSRDGKVIVSGTIDGFVAVWNAESHSILTYFKAHDDDVRAVDVSPDATKIATGSIDKTACVWSLSTGDQLLRPLKHNNSVVAAKFSPDGRLIATATYDRDSVRIYDSQNGSLLVDFPIKVNSSLNQSLAWTSNSKQLFALSHDGHIYHVDVSARTTPSKWRIHNNSDVRCISLASNGTFLAVSDYSSVSLWDTTTRKQVGSVDNQTHAIWCMAISSYDDLVTGGKNKIAVRTLRGILPPHYLNNTPRTQEIRHTKVEKTDSGPNGRAANLENIIQELRNQLAESQQTNQEKDILIQSLRAQEESSNSKIARFEKSHEEHTESQHAAIQEKDGLNETIIPPCANLYIRDESSSDKITHLERTNQELRVQLADAQRKADCLIRINRGYEQKYQCESLYTQGHIQAAAECLLEIVNTVNEDVRVNKFIMDWLSEFTPQCITALERVGDKALSAGKCDEAVASYSTALTLGPTTPNAITTKWVNMVLKNGSAHDALSAATKFKVPRVVVYRAICDILQRDGRLLEAVECFRLMLNELPV